MELTKQNKTILIIIVVILILVGVYFLFEEDIGEFNTEIFSDLIDNINPLNKPTEITSSIPSIPGVLGSANTTCFKMVNGMDQESENL